MVGTFTGSWFRASGAGGNASRRCGGLRVSGNRINGSITAAVQGSSAKGVKGFSLLPARGFSLLSARGWAVGFGVGWDAFVEVIHSVTIPSTKQIKIKAK